MTPDKVVTMADFLKWRAEQGENDGLDYDAAQARDRRERFAMRFRAAHGFAPAPRPLSEWCRSAQEIEASLWS